VGLALIFLEKRVYSQLEREQPYSSFCPETAIFRNFCVNLQACLCGERMFASAQPFDFLELAENISFPDQKLY
jgi:hypothetical protein